VIGTISVGDMFRGILRSFSHTVAGMGHGGGAHRAGSVHVMWQSEHQKGTLRIGAGLSEFSIGGGGGAGNGRRVWFDARQ